MAATAQLNRGSRRWRGRSVGSSPRRPPSPSPAPRGITRGWPPLAGARATQGALTVRGARPGRRRRRPGKKEAASREGGARRQRSWWCGRQRFRPAAGANSLRQMRGGNRTLLEDTCFFNVSSVSLLRGYRSFEDADPTHCWR
jgi:hypothetical protein